MAKPFQIELAPHTSEKIYQQLLYLGTSTPGTRKYGQKGKINKRPAFAQKRTISDHESDQLPLQFYNFHYNTPRSTSEGIKGDVIDDELKIQHNTSPCPSLVDNTEEDSIVKMKKIRATSAYVRNPEFYNRNPDLFLSCTPNERKHLNTFKPISWNQSYQALRFNKEWGAKTDCRATKRTSEIVKHRIDRLYVLNGSGLKLQNKYSVDDGETQLLRELSKARQELRSELREATEIKSDSVDSEVGEPPRDEVIEMSHLKDQQLLDDETVSNECENVSDRAQSPEMDYQGDEDMMKPPQSTDSVDPQSKILPSTSALPVKVNGGQSNPTGFAICLPNQEFIGVKVFDLLSHKSSTPCGQAMVELSKYSKVQAEQCKECSVNVQPDEGRFSFMPYMNKPYSHRNPDPGMQAKATERLVVEKHHRMSNLTDVCAFKQFPVRKQYYKFLLLQKVPDICVCECKFMPTLLGLRGRHVSLVTKS